MSQDINGDRAIPCAKMGVLIVPEPVVSGHLVDKNEWNPLSCRLIGCRKIAWTSHYCVTMIKNYSLERLHYWADVGDVCWARISPRTAPTCKSPTSEPVQAVTLCSLSLR